MTVIYFRISYVWKKQWYRRRRRREVQPWSIGIRDYIAADAPADMAIEGRGCGAVKHKSRKTIGLFAAQAYRASTPERAVARGARPRRAARAMIRARCHGRFYAHAFDVEYYARQDERVCFADALIAREAAVC